MKYAGSIFVNDIQRDGPMKIFSAVPFPLLYAICVFSYAISLSVLPMNTVGRADFTENIVSNTASNCPMRAGE